MITLRDLVPPALYRAGARAFFGGFLDEFKAQASSSSALGAVVRALGLDQNGVSPTRTQKQLAAEAFEANIIVYRAVMLIASGAASVPWLLYSKRGTGKRGTEIEDSPFLDLLSNPNDEEGTATFFERVVAFLIISGNVYIRKLYPTSRTVSAPVMLEILRPDRVTINPGPDGRVASYTYKVGNEKITYQAAEIIHIKLFAASRDYLGVSPLEVAARAIDIMNEGAAFNLALLRNSGRLPGFFVMDGKIPDTSYSRMEAMLLDRYTGARNAGLPGLLEGGLKWQPSGIGPNDMDWSELDIRQARYIAMAIGVPSELLGDAANKTYSNMQEARKGLYTETVIPVLCRVRDELNRALVPLFGKGLWADFDKDGIDALQEDRAAVYQRVKGAWWMTINEARDATGLDERKGPEGELILVPAGYKTLDQIVNPPAPPPALPAPGNGGGDNKPPAPAPGDPPEPTPPKRGRWADPLDAVLAGKVIPLPKAGGTGEAPSETSQVFTVPAQLDARDEQEAANRTALLAAMQGERERVLGAASAHVPDGDGADTPLSEQDLETFRAAVLRAVRAHRDDWRQALRSTNTDTISAAAAALLSALADQDAPFLDGFAFDPTDPAGSSILDSLASWADASADAISQSTADRLSSHFDELASAGAILLAITASYDAWTRDDGADGARVDVITTSATVGAWSSGEELGALQLDASVEAGYLVTLKTWTSVGDEKVRDAHADADGQEVESSESFDVGGESLDYPGDPNGSPGNVINCRCGLEWRFQWTGAGVNPNDDLEGDAA